eukprot:UN06336
MGNSLKQNNSLKEVADHMKKCDEEKNDEDESKANQSESNRNGLNKHAHIDFDNLTFAEKVRYGLNDIELKDKLCVIGYVREHAINKYNMDIPA